MNKNQNDFFFFIYFLSDREKCCKIFECHQFRFQLFIILLYLEWIPVMLKADHFRASKNGGKKVCLENIAWIFFFAQTFFKLFRKLEGFIFDIFRFFSFFRVHVKSKY